MKTFTRFILAQTNFFFNHNSLLCIRANLKQRQSMITGDWKTNPECIIQLSLWSNKLPSLLPPNSIFFFTFNPILPLNAPNNRIHLDFECDNNFHLQIPPPHILNLDFDNRLNQCLQEYDISNLSI